MFNSATFRTEPPSPNSVSVISDLVSLAAYLSPTVLCVEPLELSADDEVETGFC